METLGAQLRQAGLDELVLAELFGAAWTSEEVPLVLDRYRADDPRAALVRLFVLGERVPASSLPLPVDALVTAGLADLVDEEAVALVRLAPFAGLLVAHDPPSADAEVVTGVNAASRTLATLTVRRPVERALDLGTGSGVEALLASRHAAHVVATDVNPRALRLAELSARLSGASLDLREGSLFEPVEEERFDLIVANPPFVISPDTALVFRDSRLPGDEICRQVVRGAAAHLQAGGFATVLCNWICREPSERWEPLLPWVDDLPCDVLLVAHGVIDPFRYASRWNESFRKDAQAYAAAVSRWLDYYEREGITGIGIGAVVLRGREDDRPGRLHAFAAGSSATGAAGEHIVRIFEAGDLLERLAGDESLLDERLALVPGHRLEQTLVYGDEYAVAGVTMSLADGIGLVAEIEPGLVPLLFTLTPEQTVGACAQAAGLDPADVVPTVRLLLERGFLRRSVD
jgi:methylase of polypeptide subunit release factors